MKTIVFILCCCCFISCKTNPGTSSAPLISADTLSNNLDLFIGKKINIEGKIIHVCPVEGQKMKLLTDHQHILKIISSVSGKRFNRNWNSKKVRISGTVQETRLPASYIDSIERTGTLLCHIDHSPCIDNNWVAAMHKQGRAKQTCQKAVEELRKKIMQTHKNYVSVIILIADKIEELHIVEEPVQTSQKKRSDNHSCAGCPLCSFCQNVKT